MIQSYLTPPSLGRKQRSSQADWRYAISLIQQGYFDWKGLDRRIEATLAEISTNTRNRKVAFAWSGGKDSLVLEYLMKQLGITDCMFAMSNLEYPAFLSWVTEHMPDGLEVLNTGQDLKWLAKNPDMLFPKNAAIASKWFHIIQHKGQTDYFKKHHLDLLITGRRLADGNYIPEGNIYTNSAGVTRYSPMANWSHEDVLALIERERIPLPPTYGWPRGYQVGTGAWPGRQWTLSTEHGWSEVWEIDQSVVRGAAALIPSAQAYLDTAAWLV